MKQRWNWLAFILLPLLLLTSACGTQPVTASPLTGSLSELSGTVESRASSQADFHAVTNGEVLQPNGQVQTGADGRARLDLSSGTIVRVAPSSLFTLESNEPAQGGLATKLKLELGRIYIILNGGSMDVETPSGVASVRGSYMMVEINPVTHDVIATCLEGNCSAGGMDFTSGQKITFPYDSATGGYLAPRLENMNDEDFQKWLDDNPKARQVLDLVLAAQPTATPTPVPPPVDPTFTPTPVTSSQATACLSLLTPENNAVLNSFGTVIFSWETQVGAEKYRLSIISASGAQNIFETASDHLKLYIESLQGGGYYSWSVTVLDASGAPVCTSNPFAFSKPISPTPIPTKPEQPGPACTYQNAQWFNQSAPCYCDPYNVSTNPPYCSPVY